MALASVTRRASSTSKAGEGAGASRRALVRLGYTPSVAQRIQANRPELVGELVADGAPADRPLTIFRGIAALPQNYDPVFRDNHNHTTEGKLWFTRDPANASGYAAPQDFTDLKTHGEVFAAGHKFFGLVLELQVPPTMLDDVGAMKRQGDLLVRRDNLGNESDFISHVWVTEVTDKAGGTRARRFTYDAFKARFGKDIAGLS